MAKAKNGNKAAKWTGIAMGLLVLGAGLVATFTVMGENIKETQCDVVILKKEGCDPTDTLKYKMVVVEKDVETIQTQMRALRTEQKEGVTEILKAINSK